MKNTNESGICTRCMNGIPGDTKKVIAHLLNCPEKKSHKNAPTTKYIMLLLEDKNSSDYRLIVKIKPEITMKKLDSFIKDIWVECCGHMSAFLNGSTKISMNQSSANIFTKGAKLNYTYDLNASTQITISYLQDFTDEDSSDIQILFRNTEPEAVCAKCGSPATLICSECMKDEKIIKLCKACSDKHPCVVKDGKTILLPIVNSPRAGVCGYGGHDNKRVQKYFPKEII